MQDNRAYRIHDYGGPEVLQLDDAPVPSPSTGQILVKVTAAAVNGLDWKIRQGLVKDGFPMTFPAVLGIELAGVVIAAGAGGGRFRVNDRVMGPIVFGAYANYAAVREAALCLVPPGLTDVQAAAIPVAALTAWQALRAGAIWAAGRGF
jgi:N-ethylmaleimide reductase